MYGEETTSRAEWTAPGFVKENRRRHRWSDLPRTAAEQATVGEPITRLEDLQPGDRLYFKERSETRISHTGIYLLGHWNVRALLPRQRRRRHHRVDRRLAKNARSRPPLDEHLPLDQGAGDRMPKPHTSLLRGRGR